MTDGLIRRSARVAGCGFVATAGLVVTAHHVVRHGSGLDFQETDAELLDADEKLDLATLRVDAAFDTSPLSPAAAGDRWTVLTQPQPGDPQLTGTVSATDRKIVNEGGHEVVVLQLDVDQHLDDYGGYSGSAVRHAAQPHLVLGVLTEQVLSRLRQTQSATNVLYAIPATSIANRFGLPLIDGYPHIRALIASGDLDGADRSLAGTSPQTAAYWHWRARIAYARGNLDVALAYADKAVDRPDWHPHYAALRIKILLVRAAAGDADRSARLIAQSRGASSHFDEWLDCLAAAGLSGLGIRSADEIDRRCPFTD